LEFFVMSWVSRRFCAVVAVILAALFGTAALARAEPRSINGALDLALVLAIDCSGSVDATDYRLQMDGLSRAFRDPSLWTAVAAGPRQRIGVAVVQWAGRDRQHLVQPWTIIDGPASADKLSADLQAIPRAIRSGGTSISNAISFSAELLKALPVPADRMVIDVSGDGENNDGNYPNVLRDRAVKAGIIINGLTILTDVGDLDGYYREKVIGGPGAFVITANDYSDYPRAILAKLLREIQPAVAAIPTPEDAFSLADAGAKP
jgi:Protein of unknown function (DUF1194)